MRESIVKWITYAYIRRIKKWMDCPNCKHGKLTIDKKSIWWTCQGCGYKLSADKFEDDYVFWFCDKCESYLNNQEGFSTGIQKFKCKKCGYLNDITADSIEDRDSIDTVDFDYYYARLSSGDLVDETCFYFTDDLKKTEHYIGFRKEFESLYWSGDCDIPDGVEYKTADELINAPIWNGKSLKERWENVRIDTIEGMCVSDWLKYTH